MSGWYFDEKLAKLHHAQMLREAHDERLAKDVPKEVASSSMLPRLFQWLEEQTGKTRSLASQKRSYLDNPDPFKNCVTC